MEDGLYTWGPTDDDITPAPAEEEAATPSSEESYEFNIQDGYQYSLRISEEDEDEGALSGGSY